MKQVIETGLPTPAQPFSWATQAAGLLFTAHGPVRPDGSVDTGDIARQARLTFENLKLATEAAGADLNDVVQVLITLLEADDVPVVDALYGEFFAPPYPNRSTVIAKALVVPGMRIEIVAYVALPDKP
ncbi:Endoribonuclease L-PSP [Cupriavidus necator]|uniref:Endoribonuclease L-PSP n=1 Tax=Cupriavidus necator (strain ATCC 17699 / DSM 428 / KCTC 22496 / NCIMB 10442 / H16 / Stanier 337) TaxID=381666 RepID=Q0K4I7_CUPNH|nr:RidA family protein [Cupriavidus necator]KUE86262.1 enamine deaminase RidA [Cupriavidus necator]QCC03020.1 RidA family protein [Cupriavidus necator H16]QQB80076.1 RidA family protein [Cupriavidus necator]WKA44334.1 RidA family protein [Cupriavidus necator]CAJ95087.1 Endoribonuclease L-PSP [Cupriavidus necator H16]